MEDARATTGDEAPTTGEMESTTGAVESTGGDEPPTTREMDSTAATDPAEGTATLRESYTEMSEILMPNDTNNFGRALGGSVLHWMDICGAIASRRFARTLTVTASMDHVDFIAPIDLGDIVVLRGYVFETGRTSMSVSVSVEAESPERGERGEAASSDFTFVAVDDDMQPTGVPDIACPTDDQQALRECALERHRDRPSRDPVTQ